jgi:alpha-amylase
VVVVVVVVLGLLVALAVSACAPEPAQPGDLATRDFRDEVIYQVVTDRFADGDPANNGSVDPSDLARHQGGDFRGIREQLDYLERLGATMLWISPVVENVPVNGDAEGYHGYWASDFTRINPRFGSEAELRELVDAAHARGIKVLLDVVVNHAGPVFFYDLDADGVPDAGEREPPFSSEAYEPIVFSGAPPRLWRKTRDGGVEAFALGPEHFHRRGRTERFDGSDDLLLGDFPTGLRDLATSEPAVIDALADTYVEWVRRSDVDGFRLDAAPHMSHADWQSFCTRVRSELAALGKQRFLLLGEVFRGAPAELAAYTQPGEFDAVFDFTLKWEVVDRYLLEGGSPEAAAEALVAARAAYPTTPQAGGVGLAPADARVAFGDNHDMARLRGRLDDERAVSLALTVVFTADAVPALYYGTEQGLSGTGGHGSREVLWTRGFDESAQPYRFIQRLAQLRRDHPALRRGQLVVRHAAQQGGRSDDGGEPAAEDAGVLAYERSDGDDRVLVVLNGAAAQQSRARFPTGFAEGTELRDLLGGPTRVHVGQRGAVDVTLAARSALVLVPH